ncbi:FAD:protein FMN transferase [Paracoccus lutimaris]|uniref:FAD:protein FMN transferase n=1 Tax=Paracoccus lutimaris TaxID=1490030 RepID=A0A368YL70_9RHOB|nr:FAD:protein FMN transferase [Paracoccus lutimaris]RCW79637.1 thiamine biosynthesis lipoprotein [Paracoccus lutimaris]
MKRRRFLTITAGLLAASATGISAAISAAPMQEWRGIALGASARIALAHPDAARLIDAARAEIVRLERVFSLYRADSELMRLNASGRLEAPSLDLVTCLGLCDRMHQATKGAFDPSVQPLWDLHARAASEGRLPQPGEIATARARIGWQGLRLDSARIEMRPGMALTLNGVAQGFIADRVAALLRGHGVENVLIDTGEIAALGQGPDGKAWPVTIRDGRELALRDRALATSAPLGTVLDAAGTVGHIFDPASGRPAGGQWRQISVSARSAAVADALSTAACLMPDRAAIEAACQAAGDARLEQALAAA